MVLLHRTLIAGVIAASLAVASCVEAAASARKPVAAPASGYERRADVREFIDELVKFLLFSRAKLRLCFSVVRYHP